MRVFDIRVRDVQSSVSSRKFVVMLAGPIGLSIILVTG